MSYRAGTSTHDGEKWKILWTHSAVSRESITFWPPRWRIRFYIRVHTTLNHSHFEMKVCSSQLSPKNVFWASMGFEGMASALALQCSTNWAMKTHTLGAGHGICWIHAMITPSFHLYVCSSHNIHMFHSFHGYDEFNKLGSLSLVSISLYLSCLSYEKNL